MIENCYTAPTLTDNHRATTSRLTRQSLKFNKDTAREPRMTDMPADHSVDSAADKLADVKAEMAAAAQTAGRRADEVALLAVSKTKPVDEIEPFIAAGHRHFAENRVQEAAEKWPALQQAHEGIELHLIGPLQSNKTKQAVDLFDVIHTLDRAKLARKLAEFKDRPDFPKLFIQVNTGAEPQKAGIEPEQLADFHALCRDLGLTIDGLMCIPPIDEAAGPHFALLGKLAAQIGVEQLSMGMTADYPKAIGLGASHIRVGTQLFGARQKP